jgi:uncharacterized repeat protein (TIGR03809 family)
MGDRPFRCPVSRADAMPERMQPATIKLQQVAQKWRMLAERRRDHFFWLYESGRWNRYYSDHAFLDAMRQAIAAADRWAAIAPTPEELAEAAKVAA